ncbi:MAG: hypothetical protein RI947_672 [Candidatus Parcubacteria bacterium]|jgi:xylulokinase
MRAIKQTNSYYLVINLGLRSIRAVLFDSEAHIIEKNWYPVQTEMHKDTVEQNPQEWWSLAEQLLNEMLSKKQEYRDNLVTMTVTSSACCLVVTDSEGKPLMNSLIVSDKRSFEEAKDIKESPKLKGLFSNPNFLAVPSYMMPKILWLKRHHPSVFNKAAYFMSSNDFLIYKLTGKLVTDPLNAEKFYYDIGRKQYPNEVLEFIGIKTSQLPHVFPSGTDIGPLISPLRKSLKLSSNIQVTLSTYDAICAFFGSGVSSEGDAANVCGTVSSVRVLTKKNVKLNGGILTQQYQTYKIIGGSNNIDGGLLEWSKNMFYGDSYPEKYVYKIMEDEAEGSSVGSKGIFFTPYIVGERLPFFDAVTRGIFFGLERFHTRSDIIRSIFEASSYMVHDIIQSIEQSGIKVGDIRMSGGLTRNKIACKIRADITGKTIRVMDEVETTSLGALFIVFIQKGVINRFKQAEKLLMVKDVYEPDKKNHEIYKKLFNLFKKIYNHNKVLMDERRELMTILSDEEKHILSNL